MVTNPSPLKLLKKVQIKNSKSQTTDHQIAGKIKALVLQAPDLINANRLYTHINHWNQFTHKHLVYPMIINYTFETYLSELIGTHQLPTSALSSCSRNSLT